METGLMLLKQGCRHLGAILLGCWSALAVPVLSAAEQTQSAPFYRNYKFLEYTGQPTPVIGRILKDEKLGRLKQESLPVKLVLARLYISLGLHFQAGQILQALVKQAELPATVSDEVWFYLGKSYYHMGYLQEAQQALQNVGADVQSMQIRAEKQHLQALILMARNEYRQAADLIQKNWWQAPGNWDLYTRFNLAVALIQSNQMSEGLELLKQTGLKQADDQEAEALIDKVNQAMGYLLLQQQHAEQARPYLEKVRLHGPYSDMALLGAGWASAMLQEYRQALVPWLELHARDIRQIPVQEVMLSVPYAYEQLGAWGQAAEFYQQAVDTFQGEIEVLQQSIEALQNNAMQQVLADIKVESEQDWLKNIRLIDRQLSTRYIKQFMEDDEFFNVMNNYREARFILADASRKLLKINTLTGDLFDRVSAGESVSDDANREQIKFIEILAADLFKRATLLSEQARKEIDVQSEKLKQRALTLLRARKARLDVYLVQARLALAQSYDRLGAQQ